MGVNSATTKLSSKEIKTHIGHFFPDILEYLQSAEMGEDFAIGHIIYDSSSSFISNHRVARDGRLLVPGTIFIESSLRLLNLCLVYWGEKGEPRARRVKNFDWFEEVESGQEVRIVITNINYRKQLFFAEVEITVEDLKVATGTIVGFAKN